MRNNEPGISNNAANIDRQYATSPIRKPLAHSKNTLRLTIYILTLAFIVSFFSCDRIKRKGYDSVDKTKEVASDTKQKISKKAGELVDKVILKPAIDTPNTERDKKRFRDYVLTEPSNDVTNIHSYGDFFGSDYKVLIAFTCNQSTIDRIIATKKMQLTTTKDDDGLFFLDEFPWWDKDKIELLEPYKVGKENEYWKYLWYDPKTKQAFYEEFSL
ncbi:MAG TPA: hypothetical protein VLC98_15260 [Phnomibacter sp.]|nr:hypothetical protein [Phnomibacter sp.]